MVYPKVLPLPKYDFASERPIGEIRLQNRLFEDPTRTAGVRPYQVGDPLQRVHWRATARTGAAPLPHLRADTLAGATLLVDFHKDGYPSAASRTAPTSRSRRPRSIAYAVSMLNQQVGLASNGRDAADRIREEALEAERAGSRSRATTTRDEARERFELTEQNDRLRPVVVETRRGFDQFQRIRETLARLELTDASTFARLALEMAPRLPRDATVIAVLPRVPVETAIALGHAAAAGVRGHRDPGRPRRRRLRQRSRPHGRLLAEAVRDVRTSTPRTN